MLILHITSLDVLTSYIRRSEKMVVKEMIAGAALSILILAPTTYFVLPLLYPDMKDGGTIQFVYEEFDDRSFIYDSTSTFELVNQTTLTITTSGKSFLSILYVMPAVISITEDMSGALQFEVSLVVSSVGNKTIKVAYFRQLATPGSYSEIPAEVVINYVTESLDEGTYTIGVYWRSVWDPTGGSSLITNNPPNFSYNRSLQVEEIRV